MEDEYKYRIKSGQEAPQELTEQDNCTHTQNLSTLK
jgi:hypothetical protein